MEATYRLKTEELGSTFVKTIKSQFADKEVEITVRSVEELHTGLSAVQKKMIEFVADNRKNAPIISPDSDIRSLIDESQYPVD